MPEFHFMESEWGVHAMRGGQITTVGGVASMILGFIFYSTFWRPILALAISLFLATFETPFVFRMFEPCRRLTDILNENLKFGMPAVRAVLDLVLSILCFWSGAFNIMLGILLLLTAILYVFAQIVGATLTDASSLPNSDATPADGQTPFGTFT